MGVRGRGWTHEEDQPDRGRRTRPGERDDAAGPARRAAPEHAPAPVPRGAIAGRVGGLTERTEHKRFGNGNVTEHVVSFRVERRDGSGQRLTPVPVEIRAQSLRGSLSEGDWVAVRGRLRPGATLTVRRVDNLTTGAVFGVRPRGFFSTVGSILGVLLVIAVVLVVLGVFAFIAFEVFGSGGGL